MHLGTHCLQLWQWRAAERIAVERCVEWTSRSQVHQSVLTKNCDWADSTGITALGIDVIQKSFDPIRCAFLFAASQTPLALRCLQQCSQSHCSSMHCAFQFCCFVASSLHCHRNVAKVGTISECSVITLAQASRIGQNPGTVALFLQITNSRLVLVQVH